MEHLLLYQNSYNEMGSYHRFHLTTKGGNFIMRRLICLVILMGMSAIIAFGVMYVPYKIAYVRMQDSINVKKIVKALPPPKAIDPIDTIWTD